LFSLHKITSPTYNYSIKVIQQNISASKPEEGEALDHPWRTALDEGEIQTSLELWPYYTFLLASSSAFFQASSSFFRTSFFLLALIY
jgi:hypothetical protein